MTSARWLTSSEMGAWMAFLETTNLLQRAIDRQLRDDGGVTQPQYEILARLGEAPDGSLRMSDLADRLVCSRSGLTYQVAQLEKAGLVSRAPCADDERGVLAVLTEAGRDVLTRSAPGHVQVVREGLIDQLTPAEVESLERMLARCRDRLRATTSR